MVHKDRVLMIIITVHSTDSSLLFDIYDTISLQRNNTARVELKRVTSHDKTLNIQTPEPNPSASLRPMSLSL